MTHLTRRELLRVGGQAAAAAALAPLLPSWWRPAPALADFGAGPVPVPPIEDPDVKDLALRAIAACREAGASYADVRLSHTYRSIPDLRILPKAWRVDYETLQVGVRALVGGSWGFAASGIWTREEMARLGQTAVSLAKINNLGKTRQVALAPTPVVADGHWTMPVKLDPFQLDPAVIYDAVSSLHIYDHHYRWWHSPSPVHGGWHTPISFLMQEKAFASTEGSFCSQRLYRTEAECKYTVGPEPGIISHTARRLEFLTPSGMGFELLRDHNLQAAVLEALSWVDDDIRLPEKPLEVGRYDVVLDAHAVAMLLDSTLGRATELDRALGYEANAGGTSFLTDPLGMVGQYHVGADLLTVTGNRSDPGACATVQWDDEGVKPQDFTLIKGGVLTDFQVTRETAPALAAYYGRQTQLVRSAGCAMVPTAIHAPLTHTPNLVMAPGAEVQDFESLVGTIKDGIALRFSGVDDLECDMDFQGLNGLLRGGTFYQVKNGRCVAKLPLAKPGLLFRTPELWKNLLALGGAASAQRYGLSATKGEPLQETFRSVTAVPAVFKQLALIDVTRKP